MDIVLDTNVLVSALRSRRGASFKLLSLVGREHFDIHISVPLVLEYEEVCKNQCDDFGLRPEDIDDVIDYLVRVGIRHEIFYLWRPVLRDPGDDHVLEVAVAADVDSIVTHNLRDFGVADQFGPTALTPADFLKKSGLL